MYAAPASPPCGLSESDRVAGLARRYGQAYDAYLVTEPGWRYFWSADRSGVAALAGDEKHLFCSGGLLAPAYRQEDLLGELLEFAAARRQVLTFVNITEDQLPLFRSYGFQATKWGEEAIVDLPDQTWSGKPFEWVRRQTNFCRRHGLVVSEIAPLPAGDGDRGLLAEVAEVSDLFLANKPQSSEMRLLQAGFHPERLAGKRLFIARSREGEGRIEGFLACNPCRGGRMWVMETYRQRPDAVRGTTAFLLHQVMATLRDEGVERASLCLIPGLRCNEPLPGDSAMVRRSLTLAARHFNFMFDTAGAYHFKTRFRPRFENRYLCVRPCMTLGTAHAFIRLLGVLQIDAVKLCRLAIRRWQRRASRASLWTPDVAARR